VAVVGQVGCGKSSLISALLGDMEKESGYVAVQVSCGIYCVELLESHFWDCYFFRNKFDCCSKLRNCLLTKSDVAYFLLKRASCR